LRGNFREDRRGSKADMLPATRRSCGHSSTACCGRGGGALAFATSRPHEIRRHRQHRSIAGLVGMSAAMSATVGATPTPTSQGTRKAFRVFFPPPSQTLPLPLQIQARNGCRASSAAVRLAIIIKSVRNGSKPQVNGGAIHSTIRSQGQFASRVCYQFVGQHAQRDSMLTRKLEPIQPQLRLIISWLRQRPFHSCCKLFPRVAWRI
jgi:hypothetical protein